MTDSTVPTNLPPGDPSMPPASDWRARLVAAYPQIPLAAGFMAFLLLLSLDSDSLFPDPAYKPWLYALRIFGALAVALMFRRYWPPLGKMHLHWAIPVGLLVALGWVVGHRWFASMEWYQATQVSIWAASDPSKYYNPFEQLTGLGLAAFLIVRIGGAATVVPLVEELFWRGLVLRMLIDWYRFDEVPLGRFTWFSFVVCSAMSALEHPFWAVGIGCWVVYNLLFYRTRSLLCLMITHGVTNLALYLYVVIYQDWMFWT